MELAQLVLNLLLGVAGGVLSAGFIARASTTAQRCYEAELRLSGALQGYRNQLKHRHDQLVELGQVPDAYASWHGQEVLAETVLLDLRYLPRRKQRQARQLLQQLVGMTTFRLVEGRMFIPAEYRTEPSEKDRAVLVLREEGGDLIQVGLLRQLKRTETSGAEHERVFKEAMKLLDQLVALVSPGRDGRLTGRVRVRWP